MMHRCAAEEDTVCIVDLPLYKKGRLGGRMSLNQVRTVIANFLRTETPEVLAISGDWGVGKTFSIREIIGNFNDKKDVEKSLKKYAYVSLFGLNSMAELRTKIWSRTEDFPVVQDKSRLSRQHLDSGWAKKALSFFKSELPYGKSVVVGLEAIVSSLVADSIIWFDDLERLSGGIRMEDFMGLVSELKEQSRCKIIIVYNGQQLGDKEEIFTTYSEKVIDQKLAYEIDTTEAITLGLRGVPHLAKEVEPFIAALNIRNIRVVQRIGKALTYIYPLVQNHSTQIHSRVAKATAIFSASIFENSRGFPSPKTILHYNSIRDIMERNHRPTAAPEEPDGPKLEWKEMLGECGFDNADALDMEVLKAIEQGYSENTKIKEIADELDTKLKVAGEAAAFHSAWNEFHYRLDFTGKDLADKFVAAVKLAPKEISPGNMSSTVKLMRELELEDVADQLIDIYIQGNGDDVAKFMPHHWQQFDVDLDPRLEEKMSEAVDKHHVLMTLSRAAALVIENKHWDDEIADAFTAATPQQLADLLHQCKNSELPSLLSRLPSSIGGPGRDGFIENLRAALNIIGAESALNAIRVRRWLNKLG